MGETIDSSVHDNNYAGAYGSSQSAVYRESIRLAKANYRDRLERAKMWCKITESKTIDSKPQREIRKRWNAGLGIYNKAFMYLMLKLDVIDQLPLGGGYGLELCGKAATRAEQRGHNLGEWSQYSDMGFYNGTYPASIINGFQATCIHCGESVVVDVYRNRIYGMPRRDSANCGRSATCGIIWTKSDGIQKDPYRTDYVVTHAIRDLPGASVTEIWKYCNQKMDFKGTYGKVYKSVNRLARNGLIKTESVRNNGRWRTVCYIVA